MKLADIVTPRQRFSRSVNVELDTTGAAIEGYLPTGRALDVVGRVVRSISAEGGGRAFSITGPHGSGKSSLGVFLGGLLAPSDSDEHRAAALVLSDIEPNMARLLADGRRGLNASHSGFIRAAVAAEREPVVATVARALEVGARRYFGPRKGNPIPPGWGIAGVASQLSPRDIREKLILLSRHAPVLLLIDEFGKNLEAYADSGRDGDPFLLQQLAEWARGADLVRLVVVTMQHLAFEEYVQETSAVRRREWVKVQGRFEDIAYVETASQSRHLISSAFQRAEGRLNRSVAQWMSANRPAYSEAGLRDLFEDGDALAAYPIHPVTLAALPELCARYGQNERTLFSFLAGPEPQAVPEFLKKQSWTVGQALPFITLSNVYDYFVASASTLISSAAVGSRWVEIESRIRDTAGLSEMQLRTLKSIGVLNLISAGGTLRASRPVLTLALGVGSKTRDTVAESLRQLEDRGLITYRDFADEYRIWQGTDFDLKGAVEAARRRCATRDLDGLLNQAAPPSPLVATRHSQQFGTLRIFERRFSSLQPGDLSPTPVQSEWDGRVLLSVTKDVPVVEGKPTAKPIVVVVADGVDQLRDTAVDAAALAEVLASADCAGADWVARRELIERLAIAQQRLHDALAWVYEGGDTRWILLGLGQEFAAERGASRVLSDIADYVYDATPPMPNEMLARRELTSQGAKARRLLIEAMLAHAERPLLGIEGFPAERAMYDAVLARPGLHGICEDGTAAFRVPTDERYRKAWQVITDAFDRATSARVEVIDVWRQLQAPPIGLKDGPIPVLLIAVLLFRQLDIALYEHGTLVLTLDDAVAERLLRNPGHFAVKNTAAGSAVRMAVVTKLAERLNYTSPAGKVTFLGVARRLFGRLRHLEPYALSTKSVSAAADGMRKVFRSASEPDRLLFDELPRVFGIEPIASTGPLKTAHVNGYVEALGAAIEELESAYPALLDTVTRELARALGESSDRLRRSLSVHASPLADSVLDPRLRAFVSAACRDELDDRDWLENLAMVVADAQPPRNWNDDTVERFRLAATELGGSFRRVSALIAERKALESEPVDTVPVAVTRVDGSEGRLVLWVTAEEKRVVEPWVVAILEELAIVVGSSEKAREVLLASLLDHRPDAVEDAQAGSGPKVLRSAAEHD